MVPKDDGIHKPSFYTYATTAGKALAKISTTMKEPSSGCKFVSQPGRDNRMYYLSEGFNLEDEKITDMHGFVSLQQKKQGLSSSRAFNMTEVKNSRNPLVRAGGSQITYSKGHLASHLSGIIDRSPAQTPKLQFSHINKMRSGSLQVVTKIAREYTGLSNSMN